MRRGYGLFVVCVFLNFMGDMIHKAYNPKKNQKYKKRMSFTMRKFEFIKIYVSLCKTCKFLSIQKLFHNK